MKFIRKNFILAIAFVFLFTGLLSGCGRRRTSAEKRESNRRGQHWEEEVQEFSEPSEAATTFPVAQPDPEVKEKEPLIYGSDTPVYVQTNPQWEEHKFTWDSPNGAGGFWITFQIDSNMYRFYRNADRIWNIENYYKYINDPNNHELIRHVIQGIRKATSNKGYDDSAVAREIAAFVQDTIEYEYDIDSTGLEEYPRYPVETLYEKRGDCEDTSILMAALLKEWGYEVGLLHLPGHLAVAIRTSDNYTGSGYYEYNGHRYLYIESTGSGFQIGQIPEQELNAEAEMFIVP